MLYTDDQLNVLTQDIKDKIKQMTEEVERKVNADVCERVERVFSKIRIYLSFCVCQLFDDYCAVFLMFSDSVNNFFRFLPL